MSAKRRKAAVWVLVAVVGVLLVGGVGAVAYADELAESALERGATTALGVDTDVESLDVGLFSGTAELRGLEVANPAGYRSPFFLNLADGEIAVTLTSLLSDVVRIPEVRLRNLEVYLDNVAGEANYDVILANLNEGGSGRQPSDPSAEEEGGKRFMIDRLIVEDVRVQVRLFAAGGAGQQLTLPLERLELERIGSAEGGGVPIGKVVGIVVTTLMSTVLENFGDVLPETVVAGLRAGLRPLETAKELGIQVAAQAGKVVKKALDEALQEATEATKDVIEGVLGGQRGGDKSGDKKPGGKKSGDEKSGGKTPEDPGGQGSG